MQFRHIVIGLDFRSRSLNAAAFALRRFKPSRVTLAHVIETRSNSGNPGARVDDALARLREMAATLGVAHAELDVATGAVSEELCLIANDVGADLLCIGEPGPAGRGTTSALEAAIAASGLPLSTLRVPQHPAAGCVHAVWAGVSPGEHVLHTASLIAEAWGESLNALCYLTENEWSRSGVDGIEQRQLAQILHQAHVANVEAVSVDTLRDQQSVIRSLVSFVQVHGDGLIVCDEEIAHVIIDCASPSLAESSMMRIRNRCPLLTVARPGGPGLTLSTGSRRASMRTAGGDHSPSGGSAA